MATENNVKSLEELKELRKEIIHASEMLLKILKKVEKQGKI
jgi:hypothetical protein